MEKNVVIKCLEEIVGTDALPYLSGEIEGCGTEHCRLTEDRGSVYGVAVKINDENEKSDIFNAIKKDVDVLSLKTVDEWQSIGNNFYPLYWGKDINMGIRLHSHTKMMKSTGTLQLNKLVFLINKEVIYGAYPCLKYDEKEKKLRNRYPDLLKTKKGNKDDLLMEEVNKDEK
ncbi:MAG: hypothetical protein IJ706_01700 [Clostridia bacterium]|nr:hypothetical protein [Clostridia bacterium]